MLQLSRHSEIPQPKILVLDILFQDDWLLVVNKPSGLLSEPGKGPDLRDSLVVRLQAIDPAWRIVHRLDRDTSGLMVLAHDAQSHRMLSEQFRERQVEKEYVAMVEGRVDPPRGRIELPLAKDFAHPPRHRVDWEFGKPAQTDYQVIAQDDRATRLLLIPQTGRSHQLRIHLAEQGHPIWGDPLYAPPEVQARSPRLLLHASQLALHHPVSGAKMTWQSEIPF